MIDSPPPPASAPGAPAPPSAPAPLHAVAPGEAPPALALPDLADPAAVVAYLCATLRTAPGSGAAVAAMRSPFVRLAAQLEDTSPEWAELRAQLQASRCDLRAFSRAVKAARVALRAEQAIAAAALLRARIVRAEATDEERIAAIRDGLAVNSYGQPRPNAANLTTILSQDPRWRDETGAHRLAYHEMRESVYLVSPIPFDADDTPWPTGRPPAEPGPWTESMSTAAAASMARWYDIDVSSGAVTEAIEVVSRRRVIDPVREYLSSLVWDGHVRLNTWLADYFRAAPTEYVSAIGVRWMISGAARTFAPGCKVDLVLVVEGAQGIGKSTGLAALCPDPSLFLSDDIDVSNAQAAGQTTAGKWIVELGELSAMGRHDLRVLKAYVTRPFDTWRKSYGRYASDHQRRFVMAATTNDREYFDDEDNRRFLPFTASVGGAPVDVAAIVRDRDQLWAEAVVRYRQGEAWHINTPELAALCRAEQNKRRRPDPWEPLIAKWLDSRAAEDPCRATTDCTCFRCSGVTTTAVLMSALNIAAGMAARAEEMRAAKILRQMGWIKGDLETTAAGRVRPYYPSPDRAAAGDWRERWGRMTPLERHAYTAADETADPDARARAALAAEEQRQQSDAAACG